MSIPLSKLPTEWQVFICQHDKGEGGPIPPLKPLSIGKYQSPTHKRGEDTLIECDMIMLLCGLCDKPRYWLLHKCTSCGEIFLNDFRHPANCYNNICRQVTCYDCLEKEHPNDNCDCDNDKIKFARAYIGKHEPYFRDIARRVKALQIRAKTGRSVFNF